MPARSAVSARACARRSNRLPERVVDTSRCVVCFDCTAACPNEAITYRTGHFRLDLTHDAGHRQRCQELHQAHGDRLREMFPQKSSSK